MPKSNSQGMRLFASFMSIGLTIVSDENINNIWLIPWKRCMTVFFFILLLLLIVLCPTFGAPDEVKNARVPKSPMAFIHSFMKFIEVFYNNLNSLKKISWTSLENSNNTKCIISGSFATHRPLLLTWPRLGFIEVISPPLWLRVSSSGCAGSSSSLLSS